MSDLNAVGTSALLAFQRALATTSHNVANVNTEGYSRQRVDLGSNTPFGTGAGFAGTGVHINSIERLADSFAFQQSTQLNGDLGRLQAFNQIAGRMDQLFSSPDTGLAEPISGLFAAFSDLEANPGSTAARQSVLAAAERLTGAFNSLDGQVQAAGREINSRLQQASQDVNDLSDQLARLNVEIPLAAGRAGNQPPNDLLDQRDRLIGELSGLLDVRITETEGFGVNIALQSGQSLVIGGESRKLTTVADPLDPERLQLALQGSAGPVPLRGDAGGGEIGGLLDARAHVLDPLQTQLDGLALALGTQINDLQLGGADQQRRTSCELRATAEAGRHRATAADVRQCEYIIQSVMISV